MVLKRQFISDTGEILLCTLIIRFPGRHSQLGSMAVLFRRCSWKGHSSVTLGRLLRTCIVQVFQERALRVGVLVMQGLILDIFHFWREWCGFERACFVNFTLGRCGSLGRTDFEEFALWKGVMFFTNFWTMSTLVVLWSERNDFQYFSL